MDLTALLVFGGALLVAAASPGPGLAALVARVLARGRTGAVAFTAGLAIGDVVWLAAAVTGLSALAQVFGGLFLVIKYLGACYLLYLAWKLWTAPVVVASETVAPSSERPSRLFLTGLAVTLGNPKVMVFYLALVPTLLDVGTITPLAFAELALVVLAVLASVFGAYIALALRARRLFTSPHAMRRLNRATGTVMAGAAVAIAAR